MSESSTPANGKKLAVYAINEKDGDRASWWQRIGMAFVNRDGSISIYLDALPLGTNKLHVREQREEVKPGAPAQNGARRPAAGGEEVRP